MTWHEYAVAAGLVPLAGTPEWHRWVAGNRRMKNAPQPWLESRWPLIDLRLRRDDCLRWMAAHDYPKPPRSACTYCPYHSNAEWARLKNEEPEEFAGAVAFEGRLQDAFKIVTSMGDGVPFLHRSGTPLAEADLSEGDGRQADLFGNECEGLCGT